MLNVVSLAIGHKYYQYWTVNLCNSLKFHSPNVHFTLITLGDLKVPNIFDEVIQIKEEDTILNGKFCPAKAKLSLNKYIKKESIYLDADSIIVKDLTPFFESCQNTGKPYLTEVHGYAKKGDKEFKMMQWANIEDVWEHFKLEGTKFPGTNSSFQYIKPGKELDKIFSTALNYLLNSPYDYRRAPMQWGKGHHPDELYLNGAIAKLDIDVAHRTPFYFPFKHQARSEFWKGKDIASYTELTDDYYGMSYAGDGMSVSRFGERTYDSEMTHIMREQGGRHDYKIRLLLKRKYMRG